jgi:hypothetical protein
MLVLGSQSNVDILGFMRLYSHGPSQHELIQVFLFGVYFLPFVAVDHEIWLFHVDIRLLVGCLVFLLGKIQMIIGLFLFMQTIHMYTIRFFTYLIIAY